MNRMPEDTNKETEEVMKEFHFSLSVDHILGKGYRCQIKSRLGPDVFNSINDYNELMFALMEGSVCLLEVMKRMADVPTVPFPEGKDEA